MSRMNYRSGGVWKPFSISGSVTPPSSGTAPTAVGSLTLTPNDTSIAVAWTAATDADGDLAGYEVFLNNVSQGKVGTGVLSTTLTGLTTLTNYTVGVRAYDAAGHNGTTTTKSTTTTGVFGEPTASNTGPNPSVTLTTISGDYYASAGETISAKHITGTLFVYQNNVTVTDVQIDAGLNFGTGVGGFKGTRVAVGGIYNTAGHGSIILDQFRVKAIDDTIMQFVDDATHPSTGLVIKNSYFYVQEDYNRNLAATGHTDPHWEVIHFGGEQGMSVTNNTFFIDLLTPGDPQTMGHITGCVAFEKSWNTNIFESGDFSGNYLYGGGAYQIYLSVTSPMTINNNKFHSYAGMGNIANINAASTFTQSGNTLDGSPCVLA